MSSGQMWYGSLKPQYFLLVDSAGARVTGHTFVAGDVILVDTGQGGGNLNIHGECVEESIGLYKWTPSLAARSQVETVAVLITDSSAGGLFVDNAMIIQTGGHASAYFDAGL